MGEPRPLLCRIGLHRPVSVRAGRVGGEFGDWYERFECARGCGAEWFSRNGRPRFRAR